MAVLRRPLMALAGAATVLVLLLGLAVWMSGGALPGQSLYGLKRASENFQLSVAGSGTDKAMKYLQFATSRADESGKLTGSGPASSQTADLVASTLRSADSDTRSGVRLLGGAVLDQHSATPLAPIPGWVTGQQDRISALAARLPAGPARQQADRSLALLRQVSARVAQWKAELGCACLSAAHADALGPLPCTSCLAHRPATGGVPGTGSGSGSGSAQPSLPTSPLSGTGPAPSLAPTSGIRLPSGAPPSGLPSQLPSGPVSVGSNGASVGVPGVGIGIGTGGVSISVAPTLP
ncbi:MAG TPA: DUF5667 domain-containing protein [Jatrophihabitans sp.]|nr:DUF5667 domain-containing protein [Jatrophihabitans sp.]